MKLKSLALTATVGAILSIAGAAYAEHFDDGQYAATEKSLKGKTVAFVPISMGFDLPQAWAAALQHNADEWGYKLVIRDPNWDVAAGAQALTQLIAEKPDVLIFHPLDMTAYSKLVKKAGDAGIATVQINLKSMNTGDAYVGVDWYDLLKKETEAAVRFCGKGTGTSGKIALLQGNPTTPTVIIGMGGVNEVLAQHPEIKVVATQSADWDATKAHDITATILKQNEDLCAIVGFWDGQEIGAAAAIKEAGKTGKVKLITDGAGRKEAACDNVASGAFDSYHSYNAKGQGRDLVAVVNMLLQNKPEKPGAHPIALYSPSKEITKENLAPQSCWSIDDIKTNGG
jgi:ABC-type sugar transport system substrate-binding protein